ncbi:MAG: flagellar assembly protein FliW [Bryobacteraceae bacterium]
MAQLESSPIGQSGFDPGQIIEFPAGLPAFEDLRRFLLLALDGSAIGALQSVDRPEICFPVIPIAAIKPDYEMELPPEDRELLAVAGHETAGLLALAIVTLAESGPPTANFLAPVLIHLGRRRGVQSVRSDARYSHQHPVGPTEEPC